MPRQQRRSVVSRFPVWESVALAGVWAGMYQLVRSQGRLLVRLDELDERLSVVLAQVAEREHSAPNPESRNGSNRYLDAVAPGPSVGEPIPRLVLPRVDGDPV